VCVFCGRTSLVVDDDDVCLFRPIFRAFSEWMNPPATAMPGCVSLSVSEKSFVVGGAVVEMTGASAQAGRQQHLAGAQQLRPTWGPAQPERAP
jgi:hypothetical protein